MGFFGAFKRGAKGAVREVAAEYGQNKDFLEGVCAVAALVAAADGDIEDAEKRKAVSIIQEHPTLGKLYQSTEIENTANAMFTRAKSVSGRQQLAREIQEVKTKPNAGTMAEDIYLVGVDIAQADGELEDKEREVLKKVAGLLSLDPTKFEF